jgi:Mg2+ and Co2+ transporter CorA
MNKISESIIVTYAKALRRIQTEQVDPYIELIEKELIKLYPELKDREDNALNWAYDIINADSTAEVVETLDRIKQILEKEHKEKWVCCICGKNTYDVDNDYLAGVDHLSCILNEELKKSNPLKNKDELSEIKNQFINMKMYIKQLEEHIQRLDEHYNEPTN